MTKVQLRQKDQPGNITNIIMQIDQKNNLVLVICVIRFRANRANKATVIKPDQTTEDINKEQGDLNMSIVEVVHVFFHSLRALSQKHLF